MEQTGTLWAVQGEWWPGVFSVPPLFQPSVGSQQHGGTCPKQAPPFPCVPQLEPLFHTVLAPWGWMCALAPAPPLGAVECAPGVWGRSSALWPHTGVSQALLNSVSTQATFRPERGRRGLCSRSCWLVLCLWPGPRGSDKAGRASSVCVHGELWAGHPLLPSSRKRGRERQQPKQPAQVQLSAELPSRDFSLSLASDPGFCIPVSPFSPKITSELPRSSGNRLPGVTPALPAL